MRHELGHTDEFPEGKGVRFDVKGVQIAVFKLDGDFFAIQDNCTHKNLPLSLAGKERYESSGVERESDNPQTLGEIDRCELTVECPWHHLEWDLESGYCQVRDEHIPVYEIEVEKNCVYINI